jgi:perosamine synthetase
MHIRDPSRARCGPGDEVIVPDVTWIASAAPVTYVGATPVFADVDALNWCIDPGSVEALVTPRTRAIIAVELYGSMPDWAALHRVAERHGVPVIEDSAEAIGSRDQGRPAGSLGHASVFSFHGSKTLTTGEGGLPPTTPRCSSGRRFCGTTAVLPATASSATRR